MNPLEKRSRSVEGSRAARGLRILALAVALVAASGGSWRAGEPAPMNEARAGAHELDRYHWTMGTLAHVTVWGESDAEMAEAIDGCFAELDRVDRTMTTWTADSEISRINAAAGSGMGVRVSDEVIGVLQRSQEGSKLSGGAFDITVGSFSGLWKFDEDNDRTIPAREQVEERRKLVNWKDLAVDTKKKAVSLKKTGQRITLGGIAKGHAVDRCVEEMRRRGLNDFIVQAGGDMFVSGKRGSEAWRVGIRDPRGEVDMFFAYAEVQDRAFSTSGDYERYVVKDGIRYHHILDPSTGYPAGRCRSVTVMARDATSAEILSKAVFIMGPEKGISWLEKRRLGEAVIVGADNRVTISAGLEGKVTVFRQPTDGV